MNKIARWLLLKLAYALDKNEQYPQLWQYVARISRHKKTVKFIKWLCGKLTGHELSATEHGYGGGRYIDRWCRWCNKKIQIPIEESLWAEKHKELIDEVGNKEL